VIRYFEELNVTALCLCRNENLIYYNLTLLPTGSKEWHSLIKSTWLNFILNLMRRPQKLFDVCSLLWVLVRDTPKQMSVPVNTALNSVGSSATCDVQLLVEGKIIHSHKCFLAAGSTYFETLFNNKMKDSLEGRIKLEEIEHSIVCLMIDFLHTGQIKILSDVIAKKLLVAADRFMVDKLKTQCVHFLLDPLLSSNNDIKKNPKLHWSHSQVSPNGKLLHYCIEMFSFGKEHNAAYLSRYCLFWALEEANYFLKDKATTPLITPVTFSTALVSQTLKELLL